MGVEKILEKEFKEEGVFIGKPLVKMVLHCSCGIDFKTRDRFPNKSCQDYIRGYTCFCGEKSYIKHKISKVTDFLLGSTKLTHSAEVVQLDDLKEDKKY